MTKEQILEAGFLYWQDDTETNSYYFPGFNNTRFWFNEEKGAIHFMSEGNNFHGVSVHLNTIKKMQKMVKLLCEF